MGNGADRTNAEFCHKHPIRCAKSAANHRVQAAIKQASKDLFLASRRATFNKMYEKAEEKSRFLYNGGLAAEREFEKDQIQAARGAARRQYQATVHQARKNLFLAERRATFNQMYAKASQR